MSLELFHHLHKLAPLVFPSRDALMREFDARLATLQISRKEEDGKMEARYLDLKEVVISRIKEIIARKRDKLVLNSVLRVRLVVGGDGYTTAKRTAKYGIAQDTTHRVVLAVRIDAIGEDGAEDDFFEAVSTNSRKNATPILIGRFKETIRTLATFTEDWRKYLGELAEKGLELEGHHIEVTPYLASDEAFIRLVLGLATSASMFSSVRKEVDEAFVRVLPRMEENAELTRTYPVMDMQGMIAQLIQDEEFTITKLSQTVQQAQEKHGDKLINAPQFITMRTFVEDIRQRYGASEEVLLTIKPDEPIVAPSQEPNIEFEQDPLRRMRTPMTINQWPTMAVNESLLTSQ